MFERTAREEMADRREREVGDIVDGDHPMDCPAW